MATTRRLDFNADNTELCVDVTTTEDNIREEEEEFSGTLNVIGNVPRLTVQPGDITVTVTDDYSRCTCCMHSLVPLTKSCL